MKKESNNNVIHINETALKTGFIDDDDLGNKRSYNDDDEGFLTEYALLNIIDEKFSAIENWSKLKSRELKSEMFEFVDNMEISTEKYN